tara:strand:- start:3418 stop:4209 length:792 start_codon:yes stop_codon:yes gene_type:complete
LESGTQGRLGVGLSALITASITIYELRFMNIDIPEHAKVSDILKTVQDIDGGGHVYCGSERHFSLLKICLIKLQKSDVNVYLLDAHGFTLKQVSARKKPAAALSNIVAASIGIEVAPKPVNIIEPQVTQQAEPQEEPQVESQAGQVLESFQEPAIVDAIPLVEPEDPLAIPSVSPVEPSVEPPLAVVRPIVEQGFTHPQISAIRDLEQALRRCKELGLLVIGFSDGLVAVPEALGYGADALSSADALEVESFDAYRGYEADEE